MPPLLHAVRRLFWVLFALGLLASAPAWAETRLALVIGNAKYETVVSLRNSVADARAMRDKLAATGFEVIYREDADRRSFNRAVDEFVGKLSTDTVALFYYAGHGVQIGATNYLLPIDIHADTADDIASDGIDLTRVLERVTATQARFSLAIIDACRDNPFRVAGRSLGVARGLAPSTTADGVMVVYSAGANQTALDSLSDNDPSPNGVFTREWLKTMATPGLSVQEVAIQVRQSVAALAKSVGHVQTPAVYDQSTGDFEFVPGPATAPSPAPAVVAALPAVVPAPAPSNPAPSGPAPVQTCDRLAQPPRHLLGRMEAYADGVDLGAMDAAAARAACTQAMQDWPGEVRFTAYAGRVAEKLGELPEAVRLYQTAAADGNALAQSNLGALYEKGEGVPRNDREAARLYKLAADQGYPRAMSNLGILYQTGRGGLQRDEREAVRLYMAGAEQDDSVAMTNLGVMYAEGRGGLVRSNEEAARLWRAAAAQGEPDAQRNLRKLTGH